MAIKKESKPKIKNKASMDEAAMARKFRNFTTERARAADKKSAPKKNAGVKPKPSTVAAIAERFGVTAREIRDIRTALGTIATSKAFPKSVGKGPVGKNLLRQIKEVGVAAATGKKGTTSDINARALGTGFLKGDISFWDGYEKGKKRK